MQVIVLGRSSTRPAWILRALRSPDATEAIDCPAPGASAIEPHREEGAAPWLAVPGLADELALLSSARRGKAQQPRPARERRRPPPAGCRSTRVGAGPGPAGLGSAPGRR